MEHLGANIQISVTKNQTPAVVFQPVVCSICLFVLKQCVIIKKQLMNVYHDSHHGFLDGFVLVLDS